MRPKAGKPTSDELLAQFDNLGVEDSGADKQSSQPAAATAAAQSEQDILAELDNLASQRPSSIPGTPRASTNEPRPAIKSPKPAAAASATPSTGRSSEEKPTPRKSEESARSARATAQPDNVQKTESETPATEASTSASGGGWWGGIFATASATASAAMKQAEAAVKEIQHNEEAQKWAQQVKGNVGALKDFGIYPALITYE